MFRSNLLGLEKFISACKKIESNPNYQPYLTKKELFNLVIDENGNNRFHSKQPSVLAIQPSQIKALTAAGDSLGMIYELKLVKYDYDVRLTNPWHWCYDDSFVILVEKNSKCSVHTLENAQNGILNSPLNKDLDHLNFFLNMDCLHYQKDQKTKIFNFG